MKKRFLVLVSVFFIIACSKSSNIQFRDYSKIVFLSNRDALKGQFDIFQMDLNGDNQINLTKNSAHIKSISHPVLSPDGSRILFVGFEKTKTLNILDLNTKSNLILTELETDLPQATFSPDGNYILFVNKVHSNRNIFRINADGREEKLLSDFSGENFDPCFSNDGKIAFIRKEDKGFSLCTMDWNGKKLQTILNLPGVCGHPSFSPDGKKVVFHAFRNESHNIYSVDLAGKQVEKLYESEANDIKPMFSPDGRYVVFLSNVRGMKYQDVLTVDVKKYTTRVVSNKINFINQNPKISPDGKKIVFESIKFNNSEIYIVDVDGKNLQNISNHESWDCSPSF